MFMRLEKFPNLFIYIISAIKPLVENLPAEKCTKKNEEFEKLRLEFQLLQLLFFVLLSIDITQS